MKKLNYLSDFNFRGKRVLVRVDLNVPISRGKVVDTSRIERVIPTIKYLVEQQAKVILISHFGRPKGQFSLELSLAPIVDSLNSFLDSNNQAKFCIDCIGEEAENAVNELNNGEILLLENLRFYPGEKSNDPKFVSSLAKLGDIYINDTFSCSHRSHASIVGLAEVLPCGIGFLFREEIEHISDILKHPKPPVAAIVGGSKVSTKIELLHSLIEKTDLLVIGGGMANTFLRTQGYEIGKSLCENDFLGKAKEILESAESHNCKIILPSDVVISSSIDDAANCEVVEIDKIPQNKMALDLGPITCNNIITELSKCQTIIWNGPLGAFEIPPFNVATETVVRAVSSYTKQNISISIAGGGDIVAAIKSSGLKNSFTYLSTAGGAFLEWIEGKIIPGIKALKDNYTEIEQEETLEA